MPNELRGTFPAAAQRDVCVDTPLHVTFDGPPTLSGSGVITVRDVTADADGSGAVVDSIDLADPGDHRRTIGDAISDRGVPHLFAYHPVIISGTTVSIVLHRTLAYARSYAVSIGPDVFADVPEALPLAEWRFSTRETPPSSADGLIQVAADGTGDFCTVQGAIDAVPLGNTRPVLITVAPGRYREINYVRPDRPLITVRGADRATTVISYANNNALNGQPSDSHSPLRRLGDRDLHNGWRANFGVDAADFALEDITLENSTPRGGSQAEAFRGNNDRILLNRVTLMGHQDTLRLQGRAFVTHSLVEGDVDFVWGTGAVFHTHSEYRSAAPGYVMQIRNGAGEHGHVIVDSRVSRAPGVADDTVHLARVDPRAFPHSQVIIIDSEIDDHIRPEGWLVSPTEVDGKQVPHDEVFLAEYPARCTSGRHLSSAEAADWRNPAFVLDGWVPVTVNVDRCRAHAGEPVNIRWSAPAEHSPGDRLIVLDGGRQGGVIGLSGAATTGTLQWAPDSPGTFRIGYFAADPSVGTPMALSAPIEVLR